VLHTITRHPEEDAIEAVTLARQGHRVAVLASGDALYHGMGRTVANVLKTLPLPKGRVRFHPGITAFQALCHKLGLPWSSARLFSAHFQEPAVRSILEAPFAIVYGGSPLTASGIARALVDCMPASAGRGAILAEYLESPQERIVRGTLESVSGIVAGPTSILVVLPENAVPPVMALGLPDSRWKFERHLITNPIVRAAALSRLRLPAWGVLWDLGAGSGSVGIEAAALRPDLDVWAVEKNPSRLRDMEENRRACGVTNYHIIGGDISEKISSLPNPSRVFPDGRPLSQLLDIRPGVTAVIGGGGKDIAGILKAALLRLAPGGLAVVSAVTMETVAALTGLFPQLRLSAVSLSVSEERDFGPNLHMMAPEHQVYLFSYRAPEPGSITPAAPLGGAEKNEERS
jgi:precorrin-6Y C5,15-methyltransferase (decarboxylating)